jgi:glycosyltransferase involved in cell wall biosynthesis
MKLAFIFGRWGSKYHGGFDFDHLWDGRGLTGSENSFFNAARALSARGHEVIVTCDGAGPSKPLVLEGARFVPIPKDQDSPSYLPKDCDAYLSWNEPDLLRFVPTDKLRVNVHQINDWGFAYAGFDPFVDKYVALSKAHVKRLVDVSGFDPAKFEIVPNSIDLSFYEASLPPDRIDERDKSIVFISSPDRGLHRILEIFPEIRKRVPDASLEIFYEWKKLYDRGHVEQNIIGLRVRHMNALLTRLGMSGENGVYMRGNVSTLKILKKLGQSRVLAYTCEPVDFTESFSVATMDACAAGCVPVISDVDCLGEIYGEAAVVVPGLPGHKKQEWIEAVCKSLTDDDFAKSVTARCIEFSKKFDLRVVALRWEEFLNNAVTDKKRKALR